MEITTVDRLADLDDCHHPGNYARGLS